MGCSAAVLGVQRRQPPPWLGKHGTNIQEHMGCGLGLGEGRGEAGEQKGLSRVLRPLASRLPSRAWERPPGSDQQTTETSQELGITKDLLRPGQVFSQP